jgi:hypothetical protein
MGTPPVLVGPQRAARPVPLNPRAGWGALLTAAVALMLVGATDLGLALYPFNGGDPSWRFSVLASVASGLPMLGLGVLVVTIGALTAPALWPKAMSLTLNALVLAGILVAAAGFLTAAGQAFDLAPAEVHPGLRKALLKSAVIFASFATAHAVALGSSANALRSERDV